MNLKKILALVLVLAMLVSMVPTYAFAEDVELWDEEEVAVQDDAALEDVYLDEEPEEVIVEDEPEATEPEAVEVEEPAAEPVAEEPAAAEGLVAEETNALEAIDPDAVASISGTGYETLAKAIEAATEGAYIQLRKNTSENVSIGKSISIEGDGNLKITGQIEITAGTVELIKIKTDSILITGGNLSIAAGDTGVYGTVSATSAVTGGYVKGGSFDLIPVKLLADGYVGEGNIDDTTGTVTVGNTTNGNIVPIGTGYVTQRETADSKVYYKNLAAAIADAQANETIKLLNDVTLASAVDVNNTNAITLDLNGKTITNGTSYSQDYLVGVKRGAKLTIADSSDPSTGAITTSTVVCAVKMTLKGEDAEGTNAELTVNGGKIQGKDFGISGNGTRHGTKLTINGGTIVALEGTAIYHPQVGTLTVNGGSITGQEAGIELRSGTLNIPSTSTAQIKALASPASTTSNGNGTTTVGAAVAISQHTTKKDISVNIGGGVLEGYHALYVANPESNTDENVAVSVTGGTFTGATGKNAVVDTDTRVKNFVSGGTFSSAVPEAYCAEGYIPVKNGDSYGVKTGAFNIRVMTKGEPAATGGTGYEDTDIQAAITAAAEGYKTTSGGKVLVVLSGTHAPVVPADKCFDVWVEGGSFAPTCAETDVLFLKNNSTGATVSTVATKVETNVTVSALSTYAAKIVEGTGETALTTYYENLQDAVVYARSMDKATAKAKTIILMKTVEDEVELYGDRYVYIQKGEYSANIVGADKYAIVSDDATPVTEYFAKPAVASYTKDNKPVYTTTFVKAATEAANLADEAGNFEVSLYQKPVITGDNADVYKMSAAGKLTVKNATNTDILTDVYQKIVKNDGAIVVSSAISSGATVEATYTAVAAKARIDLANGKDPLYFASFQKAAEHIASNNYQTYKNLVITPLANDTWNISSSWINFAIRVANTEYTITVNSVDGTAVVKTPADGYTTYSFVSPIAKIDNFPTGKTDDYGNPQYETRYYATVADAVKDAGSTYPIELLRALNLANDAQYELGKTDATETVQFVRNYLNPVPVKASGSASIKSTNATIPGVTPVVNITIYSVEKAVASVDLGTATAPNVKYYPSFATAAAAAVYDPTASTTHKTVVMLEDDTTEYKLAIGKQIDVKLDGKTVNIVADNGTSGFYAIDDSTVANEVTTFKTVVATASVVDDEGKTVFFNNLEDAVEAAAGSKIVTIYPDYDYTNGKFVARTLTYELSDNETLNVILHKQGTVASRLTVISKVENKGVLTTNVPANAAAGTPAYTSYSLTGAAAYVTDGEEEVYYDTFAKAAAAAVAAKTATGIKTVVLLENVETDYTLPANKQINIQKGSYTVTVKPAQTTNSTTGTINYFANVETPSEDGTVINYRSEPAIASITTGTGTAAETTFYESFKKAADTAFVSADTAESDALVVKMIATPSNTDKFAPTTTGYVLVENTVVSGLTDTYVSVTDPIRKSWDNAAAGAPVYRINITSAVASVTANNGEVKYFTTIEEAADFPSQSERNPIVLLSNKLVLEFKHGHTPIYVDKNGHDDFVVTKENPHSAENSTGKSRDAVVEEDLGNNVTKYSLAAGVAYFDLVETKDKDDYGTEDIHNYIFFETFAKAREAANNGEHVIYIVANMSNTTAKNDTYVIEDVNELLRISNSGNYNLYVEPAEGFALNKVPELNANNQPNGIVDYSVSTAVASVKAQFAGDTAVTEPTYTDLKTAIDAAIATYGASFSNGRITLLAAPAEDFTYPLGAEDQLRVVNGTYNFTKDNFTAPEGYYVVENKDSGAAYGLTFYSVKETVASIGEGDAIEYFDKLADAVTAVKALETGTGADQTNPKTVITLYKSIPDTPTTDLVTMDGTLLSLLIKDQGFDPNLQPNVTENFVEKTATETEGVNKYTLKNIVASITVGEGDDAVTTNYSTFAAAAADAVNTEKVVILHMHPLATTDIYKMPLGTLNVWRDDDGWTQPVTDLAGTAVVADGDGAYVSYKLVYVPNTNTVKYVQFIASGKEASIFYQNTGLEVYDTIDEAIKDAKNKPNLVVTPLASLDKQLNTTLTGTIADGDFFHMEDTEYDVNLVVDGFEIVRDENDPTLYTFKTAVAYVYTEMVESYDQYNNPTYVKAFFSTIANASKYASQANAAEPKTIVLLQNNTYVIKSSNEVVIAQIGDTTHNTVNSFVVTTDIEGADVNSKKISATGAAYAVWKYNVATKQTFRAEAGEDAVFVAATSTAPAVTFYETTAIPEADIKTYIGSTIVAPKRDGYSVEYWLGSDGNKYLWKWEANMTADDIAAGYKPLPEKMPEGGLTLTAQWKANEYWVLFSPNGEASNVGEKWIKVKYNDLVTLPDGLVATDKDIISWHLSTDTQFKNPWNFSTDKLVNPATGTAIVDVTKPVVAATWAADQTQAFVRFVPNTKEHVYRITFDFAGGTPDPDFSYPTNYTVSTTGVQIVNPTKEGYVLSGWTVKIGDADPVSISTPSITVPPTGGATGDRVYTAVWTGKTITLYWQDEETVLTTTTGTVGAAVKAPTTYTDSTGAIKRFSNLTKDGYRLDPDDMWIGFNGIVPSTSENNYVYRLNWIEQIPVSFFLDDEVTNINVDKNSALADNKDVPAPTKEGYTLVWTLKGEKYDMTAAVSEKMTLVGEWVEGEDYSDYATIVHNLSLEENINMNAYVKIKEGTDPSDYSVIATFDDNTTMEGTLADLATYSRSRGEYKLSDIAVVAAPQMNEPVTVTISYKGNDVLTKDLTVRGYAEDWIERSTTDNDLRELLIALLDFGAYSQLQFNYDTTNLANSKYSSGIVPSTVVPTFEVRTEGSVSGISGSKIALTLVSDTTMNMYFAAAKKGSYQFKIDGEEASATYSKKEYKVALPKIAVAELGDTHAFTVNGGNATMTVTAAPLAYAYQHQNDSGDLGNVCKAVYLYYLAAVAYFG